MNRYSNPATLITLGITAGLLLIVSAIVVSFFERFPIEGTSLAIDWKSLYGGIQGGRVSYETGLRAAPWVIPFIYPLGFLSLRASWGMLTLITLGILLISVPRTRKRWLYFGSIFLLIVSVPNLRHTADGNFEGLIIAGVLLLLGGLHKRNPVLVAFGVVLASTKPQETWLFLAAAAFEMLRTWTRLPDFPRKIGTVAGIAALIVLPCLLLFGGEWLREMVGIPERGSIMDASLAAASARAAIPAPIGIAAWIGILAATAFVTVRTPGLSREKAGMLIAASLILAPYAAGNSYLTILAIGVIPLFQARPLIGFGVAMLANVTLFLPDSLEFSYGATYMTFVFFITWAVLAFATSNFLYNPHKKMPKKAGQSAGISA
jgi:hypothetical protein